MVEYGGASLEAYNYSSLSTYLLGLGQISQDTIPTIVVVIVTMLSQFTCAIMDVWRSINFIPHHVTA